MSDYKLLGNGDPEPFRIERAERINTPCIVVCDHAGQQFPKKLNQLGISDAEARKHVTYDIGTEYLGQYIGEKLEAITFIAHYSRLVVDVNRGPGRNDFMSEVSDHITIPGNVGITKEDEQARIDEIYTPYQRAIRSCIDNFMNKDTLPFLISLHSFTPEMEGQERPWEIGILWAVEHSIPEDMIASLRTNNPDMCIGDNQPYSLKDGRDYNNTVELQATSRGIPSLVVEFRQDTVDTPQKAQRMADVLLKSLMPMLQKQDLCRKTA